MKYKKNPFFYFPQLFNLSLVLTLSLALTGCFETGKNKGSNKVLLNGSVLKGTVTQADVEVLDIHGSVIWQGSSNQNGEFTAEFSTNSNQIYTIVATLANGAMQCDATECIAPLSSTVYQFGDFIPGNELGPVAFKSAIYVNDKPSDTTATNIQINSMSTLVVNIVNEHLSKGLSAEQFPSITQKGSAILTVSLGLEVDDSKSLNLLNITLPDIVQQNSINNIDPLTASLGLINASQANNITGLKQFSDALVQYSSSPEDESAIADLQEIQQTTLQEVNILINSNLVQIENEQIKNKMTQALNKGINFTELSNAKNEFTVATGQVPSEIKASSTYWGANLHPLAGQWWWVSGFTSQPGSQPNAQTNLPKSEWVQLDYASPFLAQQIKIGISNQFQSTTALIQGSNNGIDWVELADLNTSNNMEDYTDQRNVKHITIELNHSEQYKQYRFYSQPTDSVWLEYMCVFPSPPTPAPATDQTCDNSNTPSTATTSSYRLAPLNIDNPNPTSWWLSELGSGNEEWLQIKYQLPFVAVRVEIVVKQSNQGDSASIQGSTDGTNWEVITTLSSNNCLEERTDEQGFRHCKILLNNEKGFEYYRYHSEPTSFVWLQYFRLFDE